MAVNQTPGRPMGGVLILAAIFSTAVALRVSFKSPPAWRQTMALAEVESSRLLLWSPYARAVDDLVAPSSDPETQPTVLRATLPFTTIAAAPVAIPSRNPSHPPIAEPLLDAPQAEMLAADAPLPATPRIVLAGYAPPIAAAPLDDDTHQRAFGPVTTAFIKTGSALTLALKKTGQGLLAPF